MQTVTTIGLDIAKSVFQVHGVDAAGRVVIRRQLKRRPASLIWQARRSASLRQCSSAFGAPIRPLRAEHHLLRPLKCMRVFSSEHRRN
jgi:hypothetical protein